MLLLPMAALGETELLVGGYPFGDFESSLSWRRPLDSWLAGIAHSIAQVTEYVIAVIGMEGSVPNMVWDGVGRPDEDDVVAYLLPSGEDTTYFPSGR